MKIKLDFVHNASGNIDQSIVVEIPDQGIPVAIVAFNGMHDLVVSLVNDTKKCRCTTREIMIHGCNCGGT